MMPQEVWVIRIADDIKVACFASFSKSPPHLSGYNWVARLIEQTALQSSDSFQNWFEKNVGFHSCRYDILLLNCKNNLYILHNWDVQDICAFSFLLPNLTPDNFTPFHRKHIVLSSSGSGVLDNFCVQSNTCYRAICWLLCGSLRVVIRF